MTDRGKRILYGILIAVGGVVALVIAVSVGFGVWVTRPGELIDPGRLLGADSTGYAEWTLRLEDPGTEGFLNLLIDATQKIPPDVALPPFINSWVRQAQDAKAQRDLEKTFPLVAAWTLRPGSATADDDLHLLSVSAKPLGNQLVLADWIAGLVLGRSRGASVHTYQGEKIYQFDNRENDFEATFFARRGAIFATSDLDTARQAVDLLANAETSNLPQTELEQLFGTTRETDPLRAAVTNRNGEIARIWERLSGNTLDNIDDWGLIQGVSLTGGLQADGAFEATMELTTDSPGIVDAFAPVIEATFLENLDGIPLEFEFEARAIDNRIQIDILVPDLVESLTTWMERGGSRRRGPVDINIEID